MPTNVAPSHWVTSFVVVASVVVICALWLLLCLLKKQQKTVAKLVLGNISFRKL